jgi:TRAP transporter TAXI family solute receptor
MMKMNKKVVAVLTVLMMLAFCLTGCGGGNSNGDAQQNASQTRLIFASGGTSGTYYPVAGAIAQVWGNNIDGLTVDVQSTGASAENLNLVNQGDAEIAIVQNDVMYYAYTATEGFSEAQPNEGFLTLGTVYPEVCQLVVDASAGIETVADLRGKAVSIGAPGSGVESNAKQILAAAGLTTDDIKVQNLDFAESASAIKDKAIVAAFITAGAPTTAVTELATTNNIKILSLDEATIQTLCDTYSYYTPYTIGADVYGADADTNTVAVKATIVVKADLDEELVYNLTKTLFENLDAVAAAHDKGKEMSLEGAIEGVSVPLHPGAAAYYEEQGLSVE